MKLNKTEKKILKRIYKDERIWFVGSLAEATGISENTVRKYIKTLFKKHLIMLTKSMGEFKLQGYNALLLGKDRLIGMRAIMTIEERDKRIRKVKELLKEK